VAISSFGKGNMRIGFANAFPNPQGWETRLLRRFAPRIYGYRFLMGYLPSTSFMDSFSNFFLKLLDYGSAREILNYTIYPFFPNTFKELDIHFKNLYPCQQ